MPGNRGPLGIVGGMGTSAGLLFEQMLFNSCNIRGTRGDQNYPEWIYFNASQVPDRTKSINGEAPDCAPFLIDVISRAKTAGASMVVVTCNTAHHFYESVYQAVQLPWIHLQRETARYIKQNFGSTRVGILATDGTLRSQLYSKAFCKSGVDSFELKADSGLQQAVMRAIYDPVIGIKNTGGTVSESAMSLLYEVIDNLDAPVIVAGCTELSVAFSQMSLPVHWVDPMNVAIDVFFDIIDDRRSISSLVD